MRPRGQVYLAASPTAERPARSASGVNHLETHSRREQNVDVLQVATVLVLKNVRPVVAPFCAHASKEGATAARDFHVAAQGGEHTAEDIGAVGNFVQLELLAAQPATAAKTDTPAADPGVRRSAKIPVAAKGCIHVIPVHLTDTDAPVCRAHECQRNFNIGSLATV